MAAMPPLAPGKTRVAVHKVQAPAPPDFRIPNGFKLFEGAGDHSFRMGWDSAEIDKSTLLSLSQKKREKGSTWAESEWEKIKHHFHPKPILIAPHAKEQILVLHQDQALFKRHGAHLYDTNWLTTWVYYKHVEGPELEDHSQPDWLGTGDGRFGEWQAPTQDLETRRRLDQITAGHSAGMNLKQELDLHRLNNIGVKNTKVHKYLILLGSRMEPIFGTVSAHDLGELVSRCLAWDPTKTRGAVKPSLWPLIEQISAVVPLPGNGEQEPNCPAP
jgi:hypothetical protein